MRRRSTDRDGGTAGGGRGRAAALALLFLAAPVAASAQTTLRVGAPVSGEITDADAVVTTPTLEAGYTDAPNIGRSFALEIEAAGTYRIELRSHAFDAYLVLREADGSVRAEDDDGLLATHPVVVFDVGATAPTLTVDAVALHGGRGAFEIVLEQGAPKPLDPRARIEAEIADLRVAIATREAALGPDDPQLANPLNELARRLKSLGNLAAARPLYERSLALFEQGWGPQSIEVAVLSNNLGVVLLKLGDLQGARAAAERAVAVFEALGGPDDPAVAPYLGLLGEVLRVQGEFEQAEAVFERALALSETSRGPVHPEVCQALGNLGLLKSQRGDSAGALPLFERALDIAEQVYGPDHPSVATPLANLGSTQFLRGEYEPARANLERALALLERAVGPGSVQLAEILNSIAMLDQATGDYASARRLQERIVALSEAALGPDSPNLAMALNNLAFVLTAQGEYAESLALQERALAIREKSLGPKHPDVAQSLHNLASMSEYLGDSAAARRQYERALALYEQTLGPEHPLVAQSLNNLALILIDSGGPGDRDEARRLLERSLAIREQAFGPRHALVAESLANLGALFMRQRDFAQARTYVQRALEIEEQLVGPEHPAVASLLNNLGGMDFESGDLDGASAHFTRALAIRETMLGAGHPHLVLSQLNLAELELDRGEVGAAVALLERAEAGRAEHLARFLAGASEAEAGLYTASIRTHIELGQSPVVRQARPVASAESLLAWKGQVLRAARQGRAALREALGDDGRALADRLEQVSAALSRSATTLARGETPPSAERLEGLLHERQRLERELSAAAAAVLPAPPRWQAVRDALPERALLVDLFVHREYQPHEKPRGQWSAPVVTAWVTRHDMEEPTAVALGPASAIESALRDARTAIERARGGALVPREPRPDGAAALEALVLAPLRPYLEGADLLIVSPDGALATLPFETLRDTDGRYLVERLGCVYLTDPTELVRLRDQPAVASPSLLAVGDVDFDVAAREAGDSASRVGATGTTPAIALRGALDSAWPPLSATRAEIDGALQAHAASFASAERRALSGDEATEEELAASMPRYSVVHLATHGFFQPERLRSIEEAASAGLELSGSEAAEAAQRLQGYSPGLLSGLVCAGANADLGPGRADGYLTAEEVGWLDLSGCELVVLSACDTGLGRPQSGEGLLGLRRSFLTAGARTVISSLWAVPDQETAELMGLFYGNLWRRGWGAHEALRAAQLEMVRRNRERFGGDARPVTWGAFVLDGDWR